MQKRYAALRRLWSHDKTLDSLKVALAFSGILAYCFFTGHEQWLNGLILGVIAAALAERPDRLLGRAKALVVTLACFAVASFSVRLLFDHPWFFATGLAISTFAFVMLGALGERYATIALASLILAIYTMLGLAQHAHYSTPFWQDSWLLLSGAGTYGALSLVATALFPIRPVRQAMAQLYLELSRYLALKARLLEPVHGKDVQSLRVALAIQNGRVVEQMNHNREILLIWAQTGRPARGSLPFLQWYFLAQDIHERASSAHHPYEALSQSFARSDVLFRCQRLLNLQSAACTRLSSAMTLADTFSYGESGAQALTELEEALAYVRTWPQCSRDLLDALADLVRNISTIERNLARAAHPEALDSIADTQLRNSNPQTFTEGWRRLRESLTPASRRFRHGLRLSAALSTGYALLQILHLPQGYWVMLTTVFVCQPNFSTTWRRLSQRIGGTLIGLLAGSLFISAFPHPLAQLALIIVAGVSFFVTRAERYTTATACITILVLMCFNQLGSSYVLIVPRLIDTIIGCLLAVAAVVLILPDWQGRRLHHVMARTLDLSVNYLTEILAQYRSGKNDDLPYRIARRDAHNADAELSSTLTSMLKEPGRYRLSPEAAYRFLCASHTLLGYISALGAHRELIAPAQLSEPMRDTEMQISKHLHAISSALEAQQTVSLGANELPDAITTLHAASEELIAAQARVARQLSLIQTLLPELEELANGFALASASSGAN